MCKLECGGETACNFVKEQYELKIAHLDKGVWPYCGHFPPMKKFTTPTKGKGEFLFLFFLGVSILD
jgi:hypothetical protein